MAETHDSTPPRRHQPDLADDLDSGADVVRFLTAVIGGNRDFHLGEREVDGLCTILDGLRDTMEAGAHALAKAPQRPDTPEAFTAAQEEHFARMQHILRDVEPAGGQGDDDGGEAYPRLDRRQSEAGEDETSGRDAANGA